MIDLIINGPTYEEPTMYADNPVETAALTAAHMILLPHLERVFESFQYDQLLYEIDDHGYLVIHTWQQGHHKVYIHSGEFHIEH